MVWAVGVATALGVGFTSTVAIIGVPKQPLAVGVIVKVTVMGAFVVFVKLPLMSPLPLAAIPVTVVLSLVQSKVVEATSPDRAIVVIALVEQMVCAVWLATALGVGFTNTVAIIGVPGQPFAVGVIVKVTVTGALVELIKLPLISPLPLLAIPVTVVLSLVQLKVVESTFPERTIVSIVPAEQIVWAASVATAFGVGFTRTVAVIGVPGQPLAVGVIVKVTVTGALVELIKLPLISPLPLAAIPVTVVLSLVQLKVVESTFPERTIVSIVPTEQIVWAAAVAAALGVGFTITVAVIGVPGQPLAVGVIVKVTVTGAFVVLVKLPLISPLPLAAIPVTVVLSLVQLKVVEATFPERTIVSIVPAEQIVWAAAVATALGVGFTRTVAVIGVPGQPLAVGVIVKVTVMGALVVLIKLPLISPLPLLAIPVTVLLFLVQLKVVKSTFPERTIVSIVPAEQIVWAASVATAFGVGFTKTVAVIGVPGQPFAVGVIVKVTVMGALVVLIKLPLISPLPLLAIPVTVVLFLVQLKVVESTFPERTIVSIVPAEQIVWASAVATALGVGFTRTVAVIGVPGQPLAVGVIVKVTVTGAFVVLVKLPLMSPLPLARIPVTSAVLSLVQLKVVPATFPESTIVSIVPAEQIVWASAVATALGVGFTRTVAVIGVPGQPLAVGVIVKVTVTGALVELIKLPLISPLPLAAIPVTVVLSLVQLKVVELTLPESTIVSIVPAEQIVWASAVATAFGVGFTRTVAVIGVPGQPLAVGVIVKVTVMGAFVVLVKLPLMSPLPLAAIPVTVVLSLVQSKVVEAASPDRAIVVIALLEQMVCAIWLATALGVGFTSTVAVIGVPRQPFAVGVIVKVTVTGALVELIKLPLISPLPLAAIPVTVVLSLVQLKVVKATFPERTIGVIVPAEQIVWAAAVATAFGVGFTVTSLSENLFPHKPVDVALIVASP
jgi:hypothetical protein